MSDIFNIGPMWQNFSAAVGLYIPSVATVKATAITALTSKVALGILAAVVLTYAGYKMAQAYNHWALEIAGDEAFH
jgi:hypothetical protein